MEKCDFCGKEAYCDGKTVLGPWAFMCKKCFDTHGVHTADMFKVLEPTPHKPWSAEKN